MSSIPITACHIGSQEGKIEGRRKNNFMLTIPGLNKEILQYTLQSCSSPELSIGPVEINYGNQVKKVASAGEVGDITFTFLDDMDGQLSDELYKWYELGYEAKTGKVGLAKDYKKDCTLVSGKPNGEIAKAWTLVGAWLSALSPMGDGFDMAGKSDLVLIGGTITIDNAWPKDSA